MNTTATLHRSKSNSNHTTITFPNGQTVEVESTHRNDIADAFHRAGWYPLQEVKNATRNPQTIPVRDRNQPASREAYDMMNAYFNRAR